MVRNHAKLAYNSVAAWLEGTGPMPQAVSAMDGLAENLLLQDKVAQNMKSLRHKEGALSLETIEAKPVFKGERLCDLLVEETNRAKQIIEDFMIAANVAAARLPQWRSPHSIARQCYAGHRMLATNSLAASCRAISSLMPRAN